MEQKVSYSPSPINQKDTLFDGNKQKFNSVKLLKNSKCVIKENINTHESEYWFHFLMSPKSLSALKTRQISPIPVGTWNKMTCYSYYKDIFGIFFSQTGYYPDLFSPLIFSNFHKFVSLKIGQFTAINN